MWNLGSVSRVPCGVDDLGKVHGLHGDYGCGGDVYGIRVV